MNREKNIKALISKVKKDLVILKAAYDASLKEQVVSEELKIDIKNIFENLRSALDYIARDVFEALGTGNDPKILYFPISQNRKNFDKNISINFPDLEIKFPDVYKILESIQPYHDDWLSKFNKLNNNNKHQNLVEQKRSEFKRTTVTDRSSGRGVSWGEGVKFYDCTVQGVAIDPQTQLPVPNNRVNTKIVIWVDFKFKENNESVFPFIKKSIDQIENLFLSIEQYI